jgi:hypothetical protein
MNFMGEKISGGRGIKTPVPPRGGSEEGFCMEKNGVVIGLRNFSNPERGLGRAPPSVEKIRHLQGFGYNMHLRALSSGKVHPPENQGTGGPD